MQSDWLSFVILFPNAAQSNLLKIGDAVNTTVLQKSSISLYLQLSSGMFNSLLNQHLIVYNLSVTKAQFYQQRGKRKIARVCRIHDKATPKIGKSTYLLLLFFNICTMLLLFGPHCATPSAEILTSNVSFGQGEGKKCRNDTVL